MEALVPEELAFDVMLVSWQLQQFHGLELPLPSALGFSLLVELFLLIMLSSFSCLCQFSSRQLMTLCCSVRVTLSCPPACPVLFWLLEKVPELLLHISLDPVPGSAT